MPTPNWINAADAGGIQQALDALPDAGGTVYIPSGTYEISNTIDLALKEKQHLCIQGDGRTTVLVNTDAGGAPLLHLVGVVGSWWPDLKITISGITFVGNHASGDAVVVEYPNDTMIDACFFYGHGGKAVYFQHHGTNATVRDCWMRDCKRALYAENLHHLTMHGNQTRSLKDGQVQAEHVYIEKNCREVRIVNNHFAYGQAEGIILDGTAQHVIANNTIEGFTKGIYAVNCRDMVVNANYLHSPKGVHLVGANDAFSITGNTMINNAEGAVVIEDANGSGGHVISGNVIRKSVYKGQGGIALGDSDGCVVNGNVIEDVEAGAAISSAGGRHVIAANRIRRNAGVAIDADGCEVCGNLADGGRERDF